MKAKRLNLSEFKVQVVSNRNENDVSKLMGAVLGDCHDGPELKMKSTPVMSNPDRMVVDYGA